MSFIRSTSNQEKLYVWGGAGNVHWHTPNTLMTMPYKVFYGLMNAWGDGFQDNTEYKGATINTTKDFRYRVSYKNVSITLWHVTLEHIANNVRCKQRPRILQQLLRRLC